LRYIVYDPINLAEILHYCHNKETIMHIVEWGSAIVGSYLLRLNSSMVQDSLHLKQLQAKSISTAWHARLFLEHSIPLSSVRIQSLILWTFMKNAPF